MVNHGEERFVRASFPEHGLQQVKWTAVQRTYRQASTPEELLAAIPEAALAPIELIQPVKGKVGAYFFNAEAFVKVPCFEWAQLFKREFLGDVAHEGAGAAPPALPPTSCTNF